MLSKLKELLSLKPSTRSSARSSARSPARTSSKSSTRSSSKASSTLRLTKHLPERFTKEEEANLVKTKLYLIDAFLKDTETFLKEPNVFSKKTIDYAGSNWRFKIMSKEVKPGENPRIVLVAKSSETEELDLYDYSADTPTKLIRAIKENKSRSTLSDIIKRRLGGKKKVINKKLNKTRKDKKK